MRSKKRPRVNPRTIKKHSNIVNRVDTEVKVTGVREPTTTGYRAQGTVAPDYETFFEVMVRDTISSKVVHPLKTRSIRVLGGEAVAVLYKDDQVRQVFLVPGDEIALAPGIAYQVATKSGTGVEFFVSQSAGYDADLVEIEATSTVVSMSPEDLMEVTREEVLEDYIHNHMAQPRRRGESKAALQQAKIAKIKGQVVSAPTPMGAVRTEGLNARPSMGSFDPNMAG